MMRLAVVWLVVRVFESMSGWPAALVPDLAAIAVIWTVDRGGRVAGLKIALAFGFLGGLFTVDPWTLEPLVLVAMVTIVGILRSTESTASATGRIRLVLLACLAATSWEIGLRSLIPSSDVAWIDVPAFLGRLAITAAFAPLVMNRLDRTRHVTRL